jgi:hypothetical protein
VSDPTSRHGRRDADVRVSPASSVSSGAASEWGSRGAPWERGTLPKLSQSRPFLGLENSIGATGGTDPGPSGELSGVRDTIDKLVAQEVAGGCSPDVARRQVTGVALKYDRNVREGREPPPRKGR